MWYLCKIDSKQDMGEVDKGTSLPLMEAFYTLQGEGYHKGSAAYFIRVGGCDVGCHWCDVKQSWDAKLHPQTAVSEIVSKAKKYSDTVVVTGGEPLMWNMNPLCNALNKLNIKIHIETSGAYSISGNWDWFCLSPKKNKLPTVNAYKCADELKIIIYNKDDLKFAEQQVINVNKECKLFLQPEWSRREKIIPMIVDYVLANPKWKVSLQTHKYLNIP